jgi:hypothetical protein
MWQNLGMQVVGCGVQITNWLMTNFLNEQLHRTQKHLYLLLELSVKSPCLWAWFHLPSLRRNLAKLFFKQKRTQEREREKKQRGKGPKSRQANSPKQAGHKEEREPLWAEPFTSCCMKCVHWREGGKINPIKLWA